MVKKNIWRHLNNLLLFLLSGGFFWVGGSFLEYEIAKMQTPEAGFLPTPKIFDFTIGFLMIFLSILTIAMLVIIYYKKLENRSWLWGVIFVQSICLVILAAALGYWRFIWILFPQTFSIFKLYLLK